MKENAFTNFIKDYKIFITEVKNSNNKIKTALPNILTASRLLAPLFIFPATLLGNFPLALIFASLFALTDAFDGFLARKWNTTSEFGRNLDAICDKFFLLGVIIPFLTNPIIIPTLVLEGIISIINLKSAFKNNNPKSTYLGKGKTILLSLLITLSYLLKALNINLNTLLPLIISTNIVQTITAIDYIKIDNKKEKTKENKNINIKEKQKIENISKIKKELIEYKHLKEFLTKKEIKEKEKRRYLTK